MLRESGLVHQKMLVPLANGPESQHTAHIGRLVHSIIGLLIARHFLVIPDWLAVILPYIYLFDILAFI